MHYTNPTTQSDVWNRPKCGVTQKRAWNLTFRSSHKLLCMRITYWKWSHSDWNLFDSIKTGKPWVCSLHGGFRGGKKQLFLQSCLLDGMFDKGQRKGEVRKLEIVTIWSQGIQCRQMCIIKKILPFVPLPCTSSQSFWTVPFTKV